MIVLLEDDICIGCVAGKSIRECDFCTHRAICLISETGFITHDAREWLKLKSEVQTIDLEEYEYGRKLQDNQN